MERRVLLAFFLSLLVLLAYQSIFAPAPPPGEAAPGTTPSTGDVSAPVAAPAPAAVRPRAAAEAPPAALAPEPVLPDDAVTPVVAGETDRDIVVDTELVRAVFRNRGATLVAWQLKRHVDQQTGAPIDLIPAGLPVDEPAPFTLAFDDAALTARAFRRGTVSLTGGGRQRGDHPPEPLQRHCHRTVSSSVARLHQI